jgi:hypothetical protein
MRIKGEYRDVLSKDGEVIKDTGWKSNVIVEDYGRFLAALMKKDFEGLVGIEYMAVGGGSENYVEFKEKVEEFFKLGRYLFCWDSVPGDDSERLLKYFKDEHKIVLGENVKITKPSDKTIQIFEAEISAKITLDEVKATLEIGDLRTQDLKVKTEEDKLNIYSGSWNLPHKPGSGDYWVWAKKIDVDAIKYLNPYLFSIGDGALEDKLNSDIIPEVLKEKFRTKGIPLSDTATVKKTENKWVITDEEKKKKYLIMKEVEKLNIYLCINLEGEEVDTVTNRLRIDVTFGKNEPLEETLEFEEFALLGIDKDDTFDTDKLFFINYVDHGVITKDKNMELTRSIRLTFPIGEKEEGGT